MVVKESDYIGSKELVLKTLHKDGAEGINMISATIGIPIIMVCLWYMEEIDPDDWLIVEKAAAIREFYGYTKIERIK